MSKWTVSAALAVTLGAAMVTAVIWSQIITTTNHPPPEKFTLTAEQTIPVNGKGGSDISGPYVRAENWPQVLPGGRVLASSPALHVESPNRILAGSRGTRLPYSTVMAVGWHMESIQNWFKIPAKSLDPQHTFILNVFDGHGKLIEHWKQYDTGFPIKSIQFWHVNVNDPKLYNYLDGDTHLIVLSHDGQKIIKDITPADVPTKENERTFWPEGIAFAPDGSFWVVSNARIIKFSKDFKYESQFGTEGTGPDQMTGAHDMVHDAVAHRFYICDRDNHRIQVYDDSGKHLDSWPNIVAPSAIRMTKDRKYLWVADLYTSKFYKFDTNGHMITSFGTWGMEDGATSGIHDFDTDSQGNLYVGNHDIQALEKFIPRKDGNPVQLIGQLQPY